MSLQKVTANVCMCNQNDKHNLQNDSIPVIVA